MSITVAATAFVIRWLSLSKWLRALGSRSFFPLCYLLLQSQCEVSWESCFEWVLRSGCSIQNPSQLRNAAPRGAHWATKAQTANAAVPLWLTETHFPSPQNLSPLRAYPSCLRCERRMHLEVSDLVLFPTGQVTSGNSVSPDLSFLSYKMWVEK